VDDLNASQRHAQGLESELMQLRQLGDGRVDFQHLQREMDKLIRENEDHKHRWESADFTGLSLISTYFIY